MKNIILFIEVKFMILYDSENQKYCEKWIINCISINIICVERT